MPIASINPATGETIKTFSPLDPAQIEEILQRATDVFKTYRNTSFSDRAGWMLRAAEILESEKKDSDKESNVKARSRYPRSAA